MAVLTRDPAVEPIQVLEAVPIRVLVVAHTQVRVVVLTRGPAVEPTQVQGEAPTRGLEVVPIRDLAEVATAAPVVAGPTDGTGLILIANDVPFSKGCGSG